MTLKQLKAFYWAATLGSFAIAASRLSISQSALSKRIAELEMDLGVELFDRSTRRAVATEAGLALMVGAKQMIALEAEVRDRVSRSNELTGTLRLGLGELSAATWFPKFVKRVRQLHPGLTVEPTVSQARTMELEVERGDLDCAVIAGTPTRPQISAQSLGSLAFSWMASPGLFDEHFPGPIPLTDLLARFPLIAPNILSGQLQGFSDALTASGIPIGRAIRCNSLNATVELTIAGVGVSMLPRQYLRPLVDRGLIVEVPSEPQNPSLQYCFIWRSDDVRTITACALELVKQEADFEVASPLWQVSGA